MLEPTRALLMDIDGTLLDSARAQTGAWLHVLRDFGYVVDDQQVRSRLGVGHDRILRELCGISEASPRARRLLPIREFLLRDHYLPKVSSIPGVHAAIFQARNAGAQLGVVSGAHRSEALALLGAAQLLTQFDHVICREDVQNTKPSPDAINLALSRMGVTPERALYVASSIHDLMAARAAGVPSVLLASGDWSALPARDRPATVTWADLLARWPSEPRAA